LSRDPAGSRRHRIGRSAYCRPGRGRGHWTKRANPSRCGVDGFSALTLALPLRRQKEARCARRARDSRRQALGAVELERQDWPEGAPIIYAAHHEPNLGVVDTVKTDDPERHCTVLVVEPI
jgi:hypothetical protein